MEPDEAEIARIVAETEAVEGIKPPKKYARSQAELRALQQRDAAYAQRKLQICLVATNVLISALIALKTFGII
jgi:hypothetical protein